MYSVMGSPLYIITEIANSFSEQDRFQQAYIPTKTLVFYVVI